MRTKTLRLGYRVSALAACVALMTACGGSDDPGTDAGRVGTDSGMPPGDSGMMMMADGGMTMGDAGMMMGDAGTMMGDAGMMMDDDAGPAGADFGEVITILRAACAGCHTSSTTGGFNVGTNAAANMAAYMDLTAEAPTAACGGRTARVTPGDAEDSYLIRRLTGTSCGNRMPAGRAALSAAQIDTIRSWINAGAPAP